MDVTNPLCCLCQLTRGTSAALLSMWRCANCIYVSPVLLLHQQLQQKACNAYTQVIKEHWHACSYGLKKLSFWKQIVLITITRWQPENCAFCLQAQLTLLTDYTCLLYHIVRQISASQYNVVHAVSRVQWLQTILGTA